MLPKLLVILGPTASGKTALGIEIAKKFNGEVISVDSRQVYREMDIGTGKVEREVVESWSDGVKDAVSFLFGERMVFLVDGVPHWGIDLVNPDEDYSVADFKQYAEKKIAEIIKRGHLPILVGGTGLWISAIVDNLDLSSTPRDKKLRAELEAKSLGELFHEYKQLDPVGAETIDQENKRRVVRALEVTKITGRPFSQLQTRGEKKYDVLQIGLSVDRNELNERINNRVDEMIAKGLVTEVRILKEKYACLPDRQGGEIDAMTGIGYRQICEFLNSNPSPCKACPERSRGRGGLEGVCLFARAIEKIKKDTRHYAKRQMTWFKRDKRIVWVKGNDEAINFVHGFLK